MFEEVTVLRIRGVQRHCGWRKWRIHTICDIDNFLYYFIFWTRCKTARKGGHQSFTDSHYYSLHIGEPRQFDKGRYHRPSILDLCWVAAITTE